MNRRRLFALARKEFIHVFRDWRSLVLALAIPAMLILLFGYALNRDLKKAPVTVWDQSRTPQSREFLELFFASPYFSLVGYHDSYNPIDNDLQRGRALLAIVIPGDFGRNVLADRTAKVQVIVDGSDATTARLALGYATSLGLIYNQKVLIDKLSRKGIPKPDPPLESRPRAFYNADLRSQNVIIPGILVIVMVVISAMLTSITVAKEWELGTMEQLISTPVRPAEIVFGKVVPYFVIGLVDVAVAVLMGYFWFGVPFRGNPALLFLSATLFLTGALFYGLLLSIRFKVQLQANQIALGASYLPNMLLSGFAFAIANMPEPIQWLTYIVPGRYFMAILHGIYLKGIGLEILAIDFLLLFVWALLMVVAANKNMKLKLE
jgi:ABC-2 type transport system permease protein